MLIPRAAVLAAAIPATLGAPLHAGGGQSWNRKVEAVSVVPLATGGYEIGAFISAEAAGALTFLDLDTEVFLSVNGTTIASQSFDLEAQPASMGACGVCDFFETCVCGFEPGTGVFGCRCGSFLTYFFGTASLDPGDEIAVLLRPAPGALPEQQQDDDELGRTFEGHPIFWNRSIGNVRIVPSTGGAASSFFDVFFDIDVGASYEGTLRLFVTPVVLINGVPWSGSPACPGPCGDTLVWNPCFPGGACPGLCALNGEGVFVGECSGNCSPVYPPCNCCVSGWEQWVFPQVEGSPGDEIVVILRPAPGALPELPGFGDDDEETRPIPCLGDADATGFVDVDDLVLVILNWGCEGAPGACPGDVNLDGVVNVDDVVLIILNWGPCFPV